MSTMTTSSNAFTFHGSRPHQGAKLARILPDSAELNGTLALACPSPECEVIALDVRLNTMGEWEGQLSLDADTLRCPACNEPLVPHSFTHSQA